MSRSPDAPRKRPPKQSAPTALAPPDAAPVFAALGDETRLRLVAVLCAGGAMSIARLTAGTDITRQAVTKHLQVLASAGLVHYVQVGREHLWSFDPTRLDEARYALDAIARQWDQALQRFKAAVEE
jgi:DNA-binding transcriptional ArsR family regulator